jgi:hypothetical protein
MSSLFQDLMIGLDEVDAYLANRQPEQSAPTQDPLLSFRSAAEESAFAEPKKPLRQGREERS